MPAFDWVAAAGYAAAFLTTVSFVPQVWLTLRSRNVAGVSLGMYGLFTLGIGLWLVYGLAQHNWPIVAANAATFLLALSVLVMRLLYGRRRS